MNFLLHRELAARGLGSAAGGCGAMLPDLWRMADRRVRPTHVGPGEPGVDAEVMAGVAHHLEADRWFHAAPAFVDGERLAGDRLRAAPLVARRVGLLSHVAWEVALDGALVRRRGAAVVAGAVGAGFAAAGAAAARAARRCHFDHAARGEDEWSAFASRMRALEARLVAGGWIEAYASGVGFARVLDRIHDRLGLGGLGERDRGLLAPVGEELIAAAEARLDHVLDATI